MKNYQDWDNINDNQWHTVDIKFNRGSLSIKLDGFPEDYVSQIIAPEFTFIDFHKCRAD